MADPNTLYVQGGGGGVLLFSPRLADRSALGQVEAALRAAPGIESVVRLGSAGSGMLGVDYDPDRLDAERVAAVAKSALEASPGSPGPVALQALRAPT